MKVLFYPQIPGFRKSLTFWKVPKFRPLRSYKSAVWME